MPFIEYNGKRILFVHIPRTGGTSIEHWMASFSPVRFRTIGMPPALRCTPQHLRMSDYDALFGKDYFDYAFAIVRDPYTRLESEYRLRRALQEKEFFGESMTFSMWLEINLDRAKREVWYLDNHLRSQWEFIGSGVDVHRFEDGISTIIDNIAAAVGLPNGERCTPKLVTDKTASIRWDVADRQRVADFYARDFSNFGYSERMLSEREK